MINRMANQGKPNGFHDDAQGLGLNYLELVMPWGWEFY